MNRRLKRLPLLSTRAQLDLMLAPYVSGLVVLVLAPLLITFALSFTQYDLFSPPRWYWIDNFRNFFVDRLFQRALYNSLWFAVIAVPVRVTAALLLALLLNRPGRAHSAVRAAIYLPAIVPDVAYALAWLLVLNPGFGPLNLGLQALGLPGWPWLQTPFTARASLIVMWTFQLGEGFILLLAARQTLSADLFESAALDGASRWQAFRRLTLPLLAPALLLLCVRDTVLSFQGAFTASTVATGTGPYYTTYFLPHYAFDESFGLFKYGYGSAVTMAMYGLTAVLISLYYAGFKLATRSDEF
jgi:multiple sugar transport system permease protein